MSRMFCIHCGTEIIENNVNCPECGREHDPKDRPFREFLIRHTKDELKGKAADKLFSVLKNWLLSHLYGTFLTVSVIAVLTTAAAAPAPAASYEIVSERPEILMASSGGAAYSQTEAEPGPALAEENTAVGEDEPLVTEEEDPHAEDQTALSALVSRYISSVWNETDSSEFFYDSDGSVHELAEVSARLNGVYDDYFESFFAEHRDVFEEYDEDLSIHMESVTFESSEFESVAAKRLSQEGYEVAESVEYLAWVQRHHEGMTRDEFTSAVYESELVDDDYLDSFPTKVIDSARLLFTYVKIDGTWYIADDREIG